MKIVLIFALTFCSLSYAQVGVGNTDPKSIFDVTAFNQASPGNTDGLLIPRLDNFPATDPTPDQDGMLVFLTTPTGNYKKGLHNWDDTKKVWTPYGGEWIDSYNGANEALVYAKQANANGVDVVLLNDGSMGMGTDDPVENLELRFEGDNDIQITSATPPNAPNIIYYTKGGTFSSPSQLSDNDPIGSLGMKVWGGSAPSSGVAILKSSADGNHTSSKLPTKFNMSTTASGDSGAGTSGNELTIRASGNIGIGTDSPTAALHLKSGTAAANTAPVKFNSGTNLATPETGAMEYDGTHLYFTSNMKRNILLKGLTNTATLNYSSISGNSSQELTVGVSGATTGSSCNCSPRGSVEIGLKWSCYVSSANVVTVRISNITSSSINPASKSWKVTVIE